MYGFRMLFHLYENVQNYWQLNCEIEKMSSGSGGTAAKKAIQVKYKKISFKDLEFDQGDDVRV